MMKKIRKPISIFLSVMMVVSLFSVVPFTVSAATENLGGYNFTVETDDEGSYYKIDSADALCALSSYVNAAASNDCSGRRFKQTADIDMAGRSWEPIAKDDSMRYFRGTYDGDGYFILNITHTAPGQYDISGLFGDFRGTIKNVNLKDCSFTGNRAAGIAASTYNDPSIENCSVLDSTITGTDLEHDMRNGSYIGGIAAYFYSGTVSDCFTTASFVGDAYYQDPLVGWTTGTLTDSCYTNMPGHATNYRGTQVDGGFITLDDGITMSGNYRTFGRTEENTYHFAEQGEEITLSYGNVPAGYKVVWVSDDVEITDGRFRMPDHDVSVTAITAIDNEHFSQDDVNTYTIHDEEGWEIFCSDLEKTDTYNRFSGKIVRLGADITVSTMAGKAYYDFCGTFDGDEHTLTFNYGSSDNYTGEQYIAPFRYVSTTKANPGDTDDSPAKIRNLHVAGDIYTSNKYAAGIVAQHWGTLNIENCRSSITIHSKVSGDGSHGGFEGAANGTLNIKGCVFDGKLLTTGTTDTGNCGGFVAWGGENVSMSDSLYAPAVIDTANGEIYFDPINYGIHIDEMTHGTVTTNGTAHYNDTVTLNVIPDEGYAVKYIRYNDTYLLPQTGPYTFTMPPEDVTISAEFDIPKDDPVSYLDENGVQQSVTVYELLYGNEDTLETGWYVLDDDIDWYDRISVIGDVFLILGDDCELDADDGIEVPPDSSLTIYAQSDGDSMGSLIASAANGDLNAAGIGGSNMSAGTITINGGNISVTGGDAGSGIGSGYARDVDEITINGGTVNVTALGEGAAIGDAKLGAGGKITINGGNVSATGDQGAGIGGDSCTITLGNTDDEDFIYASSYSGTVKIADGKALTDGANTYTSDTSSDILSALTDTTLTPAEFYDIIVEESAYGTVTAPAHGAAGSIITLTVEPDNGCSVDYVKVNGTEIKPEDGVYAFEMPYEAVTVTAKFLNARVSVSYIDEYGNEDIDMEQRKKQKLLQLNITNSPLKEDDKVDKTTPSEQDIEIDRRYMITRKGVKPDYMIPVII